MNLSDPMYTVKDKQDWVWDEIARLHPGRYKRENFPVDDPYTLSGMIIHDVCRYQARPGAIVMDVGANIGIFTTICALNGAEVWAFEPHAGAYDVMEETVRRNKVLDRVHLHYAAIWSSSGTVLHNPSTTESDGWVACNGTTDTAIGQKHVPAIFFGLALSLQPEWDCVKMDIEGAEYEVLLSVPPETLRCIKYLTLDLHHIPGARYKELLEHLTEVFTLTGTQETDSESPMYGVYYGIQGTRK